MKELAEALRDAIHEAAVALRDARATAVADLEQQPAWTALGDAQREALLTEHHLGPEAEPNLADSAAVLMVVQARPLQGWAAELDAIPQRASRALEAAIHLTTPAAKTATVRVSTASLSSADEVERCIQVLCRRRKNNPLLVGDPGVGKTAIAEGLARTMSPLF